MATVYKVYWDNGNGACGTFPIVFETEKDAQTYADEWTYECNTRDGIGEDDESGYTAEVIEIDESEVAPRRGL